MIDSADFAEISESRDRDWILAIGHALGLDSGFEVPVVPEVEPFKRLFADLTKMEGAAFDVLKKDRDELGAMLDAKDARIAELERALGDREGMVLLPRGPTERMVDEGREAIARERFATAQVLACYEAMIAASGGGT